MMSFAALYSVARRTGHRIVFFTEHAGLGIGLHLHQHFSNLPFDLVPIAELNDEERMHVVFKVNEDLMVDHNIFKCSSEFNYNIAGGLFNYRYWYPRRNEICRMYTFDEPTLAQAYDCISPARQGNRPLVSVHVRRGDFFNGIHNNVTIEYYNKAFEYFNDLEVNYLVFSNDIPWCREAFADKPNVFYSNAETAIIDMCSMSLCDHNIIANSTFSFWGAFLNHNPHRRVICPAQYLKPERANPYYNYGWHPDEFISLDVGNA